MRDWVAILWVALLVGCAFVGGYRVGHNTRPAAALFDPDTLMAARQVEWMNPDLLARIDEFRQDTKSWPRWQDERASRTKAISFLVDDALRKWKTTEPRFITPVNPERPVPKSAGKTTR